MVSPRSSVFAALGAALLGLSSMGCAHNAPLVQSDALPLRRVVVYRNGVAYFERAGTVEAQEVRFRVRPTEVGDFLATMAVLEKGGSSVKSASFPLKVDDDEDEGGEDGKDKKKKDAKKLVNVLLSLDGKKHELQVGYVAEMPVWRPSYRLVIQQGGTADLQAWGIVQNLSGEDWHGVRLSLVAGAPISFQPMLGTPVIPPRPIITDSGEVIMAVPGSETTLDQAPPPPPPAAPPVGRTIAPTMEEKPRDAKKADEAAQTKGGKPKKKASSAPAGAARITAADVDGKDAPAMPAPSDRGGGSGGPMPKREAMSRPRDLASLAGIAIEGSTTRYDIPVPIDVPDESATMVMLLSARVPGESVFLYAPNGGVGESGSHPFRVARFTNQSTGLLERGPIAVFEDGAFLGEGMVDPLPPGATTTVPFALERAIAVEQTRGYGETGARVAQIEAGQLLIERDIQFKTTYKVKNGRDGLVKVILKHQRNPGTRLFEPPKGTEDNTGTHTALVPFEVASKGAGEQLVEERMTTSRHVDWLSDLANEAVTAYLKDSRADANAAQLLKRAWDIRPTLVKARDELDALTREEAELMRTTSETRENLKAIEKNPVAAQLRKELTERLAKASSRLNEVSKRKIELSLTVKEQEVRFYDAVRSIKLAKGLPPPT